MRSDFSQDISHVTTAIDRYSASADDLDIVCCFLDFHDIKESPRKTQNLVTDLLESGQPVQSESQKAFRCKVEAVEKKTPGLVKS